MSSVDDRRTIGDISKLFYLHYDVDDDGAIYVTYVGQVTASCQACRYTHRVLRRYIH